jgi:hypothetical protein
MCHRTCEDIRALILESGQGGQIDHGRIHVGTVKCGGFCLPGLVPRTKRESRGQRELWNRILVLWMDQIHLWQWNLMEFAPQEGPRKRICVCREKPSSSPQQTLGKVNPQQTLSEIGHITSQQPTHSCGLLNRMIFYYHRLFKLF